MSKPTVSATGGAMPAEGHTPETYAASFLRLLALRQSIEKTLGEMAAMLGEDITGVQNNPVTIPVRCDRRAPR